MKTLFKNYNCLKHFYLVILLLYSCSRPDDEPLYGGTDVYYRLTDEQLKKTPYFTNKAFDTITFISNNNDTIIFKKNYTDTSWYPVRPFFNANYYELYQNITNTYQTIKGNGKFEVRHVLSEPNKSNTIYITFNNYTYGIGDWQIGLKEYVGYIGNYELNNTTFKEVLQLGNKGSLSYLNQSYGLFYIDDIPNNLNFILKY